MAGNYGEGGQYTDDEFQRQLDRVIEEATLATGEFSEDHNDAAEAVQERRIAASKLAKLVELGYIDDASVETIARYLIWQVDPNEKIDVRLREIAFLIDRISFVEMSIGQDVRNASVQPDYSSGLYALEMSILPDYLAGLYAQEELPRELVDELITIAGKVTDLPGLDFAQADDVFQKIENERQVQNQEERARNIRQKYQPLIAFMFISLFGQHDDQDAIIRSILMHCTFAVELARLAEEDPTHNSRLGMVNSLGYIAKQKMIQQGFEKDHVNEFVNIIREVIVETEALP